MTRSRKRTAAAAVLLAGSLVACNDSPTRPTLTPEQQRDLNALCWNPTVSCAAAR